ncbi:MAG: hypothetical protein QM710_07360 [Flavobacterium sp.]
MVKKLIVIIFLLLGYNNANSQKSAFHQGYYIDYKGQKIECLIKNEDWDINPTEFKYKTNTDSEIKIITKDEFKEFAVDEYKFKKANVKIDQSPDNYADANTSRVMNLVDQQLILRVLVEGNAVLYGYKSENYTRFFYSLDSDILQLSYKIYNNNEGAYAKNENYKQELLNNLKCDKITQSDIDELQYRVYELMPLFVKYNNCSEVTAVEYKAKKNINTLELFAKAGIGMSSFSLSQNGDKKDFGQKVKGRVALETEINFSNKAKKWSVLVELAYQYYKGTYQEATSTMLPDKEIDYKAIDISFGFRKYFALNDKASLFANGYITYGYEFGDGKVGSFDLSRSISPAIGIGYLYNKKYSLELRYEFSRDILADYMTITSNYQSIGLAFGCKVF